MNLSRPLLAITALTAAVTLSACAGSATDPAQPQPLSSPSDEADHGAISSAQELSEPALAILSVDADGRVGILDLVSGEASEAGVTSRPTALASDGRYGFVTTEQGVEIIDSGRWSWNHGDHFHYYLAASRIVGSVPGEGAATVVGGLLSTAGATGIRFAGSGEAILVDNAALTGGAVVEKLRLRTDIGGGVIAPLHDGALVSEHDRLVYYDPTGAATSAVAPCVDAAGAITTVAGLAISCADGAVLAQWRGGAPVFSDIPYPAGTATDRATDFAGRKGRPTVAALAGDSGYWLLDTRAATWSFVPTPVALVRVSAVDDADAHVVGIDHEGRVRVFGGADGVQLAVTDPLLASVTDSISLTVDARRAYVNDPATGSVFEIDYADGARIARTLHTPMTPLFSTEVGR